LRSESVLGVDREFEQREEVGDGNDVSAIRSTAPGARLHGLKRADPNG
jgi:hypothetical protein